jgi:hypothetical protein
MQSICLPLEGIKMDNNAAKSEKTPENDEAIHESLNNKSE